MTDGERLYIVETQMNEIDKKVNQILLKLDALDEKFASKWVENAIRWAAITIIGAVLVAGLSYIVKSK